MTAQIMPTIRRSLATSIILFTTALVLADDTGGKAPATQALTATVAIASSSDTIPYSRMLFGGFLEHFHRQIYGGIFEPGSPLSDAKGFRQDVIAAVRELRTPIVRWPGGLFVSAYHWRDGVGRERQPSVDKAWGGEDPNTFGTDEFVEWCRLVGAEPYICGNLGTGTPEEMSDWVEYCNQTLGRWARLRVAGGHPEPFNVRYWSIGNENYSQAEIGTKTAQEWGPLTRETAKMVRRADPTVILTAAALGDDWTKNLLKEAGKYLQMISIHGYWDVLYTVDRPSDYAACMMKSSLPEEKINSAERLLDATGFKGRITIAFDEWNLRSWHHPRTAWSYTPEDIEARDRNDLNATYTMADAVFSACFLNSCLRHADTVKMANIAPLVNTRGPLFVHSRGIVKRTTFHVLSMFANLLEAQVAGAMVTSDLFRHGDKVVPAVDAAATCDAERKVWRVVLVNRHPTSDASCVILFDGVAATGTCAATVLSGDSTDAFNDVDHPNRVIPRKVNLPIQNGAVVLPPHSVMIVEMSRPPRS
jgi:alpha-L-arabinofuranosidase